MLVFHNLGITYPMAFPEPIMVRCYRCDALIGLPDASACEVHDTDALCQHCWKHHVRSVEARHDGFVPLSDQCWAMIPFDAREYRRASGLRVRPHEDV